MGNLHHLDPRADWRGELLEQILTIVVVAGVLVAVPSIAAAWAAGLTAIVVIDLLALAAVAVARFARRLGQGPRVALLLGTTLVLGVFFLIEVGPTGVVFLLATPVMAALLRGTRAAVAAIVVVALALTGVGAAGLAAPTLVVMGSDGAVAWTIFSSNVLLGATATAVPTGLLLERIERSQQEQRFLGELLAAVGEAVLASDEHGRITYANPAAHRLLAGLAPTLLGQPLAVLVPALAALPDDATEELELSVPRSSPIPVLATTTRVTDPSPTDPTRIPVRLYVLTEISELRATIDRLHRSERIRTAFLQATSHELRTPLTAILGLTATLQRPEVAGAPALQGQLVDRLRANADRLDTLIGNLLDVERLRSGLTTADRSPTDLRALIERVLTGLDTSPHQLRTHLDPVTAAVDPAMLERVVTSLVGNAIRHCREPATIEVRLTTAPAGDGSPPAPPDVLLVVADDGPGLDPQVRDQLFEPLVQGAASHADAQPGTGLGLALARGFVELHAGQLTATDRSPHGTRFEVRFPTA